MPINIDKDDINTALKKLKAREDNLKQLESISKLGSWEVDLITKKSIWSERSYEIYGIEKSQEVNLELFYELILPEYKTQAQTQLAHVIQTGKAITFECEAKRTDGTIITLLINGQVIFDDNNQASKLIGTTQDITSQAALKQHTKELVQLIEYSSNEIYILALDTLDYLYVNKGACDALGYSSEELLTMNVRDVNPYLDEETIKNLKQRLEKTHHLLNRSIHQCKDGSLYHVQSYLHTFNYNNQKAYVIFDTDVSVAINLELKYKKQAQILEYIHDSVIATDKEGKIISWNKGSTSLFGYTQEEMLGKHILETYDKNNVYQIEELFSLLNVQGSLDLEAYMLKKDKTRLICDISLSVSRDENEEIDGYAGYIQDITVQKKTQKLLAEQTKKLKYQAHHDTLTDLPNRTLFRDRLTQTIVSAKRNKEKFALLFIDLDQFKKINDSLGHHVGDKVLIEAATRLKSTLREEDTLARLGGDEFTIILKDVHGVQSASTVAQKIIQAMKEPINVAAQNLYVTSSIGISIYPDDALSDADLIKFADVAMYKAKDEGRNNYQFYSSDMTTYAFERVVMESSLRVAIKEEQFVVYFQPQFDVKSEKIVGMEALVRWEHPTLGLIPPIKFIPLAEESDLIVAIDRIVMKKAMSQFSAWYKAGLNPGILALNLAMKQLNTEDFYTHLLHTMQAIKFQAKWLELEVTEGQIMSNPELSIQKLYDIHDMGIEVAIDDFGTGYSSLSYLKKLPLDKLKIDRSFVKDIPQDEDDMAITKAIIALGKSLNLKLIAEGVETEEQRDFLIESGCELIQGYLYSPPRPANEIEKLLQLN